MEVLPIFFLVILGLQISLFLLKRYWPLRKVPGPFLASFTDLWRFRVQYFGSLVPTLQDLHSRYGPLVRIGPDTVSLGRARYVDLVYSRRGQYQKAASYSSLKDFADGKSVDSIVDLQDENQHRAIKRAIGSDFIAKHVLQYEAGVDLILDGLAKKLGEEQVVNLYETLQAFQLDFLFKISFSEIPGNLVYGDVLGLGGLESQRITHWSKWQPMPTLERFFFRSSIWGAWRSRSSQWVRIGAKKLSQRRAINTSGRSSQYNDLLQKYIRASKKFPDAIPPDAVPELLSSTISAGVDTTAGTIATVIYLLLKHPLEYKSLLRELEQAELSMPPRYTEVSHLRYLHAVIMEALRLNPPISAPLERVVPEPGCMVAGTHIPAGTIIGCAALAVHHDRSCYGREPECFRPERWLECDAGQRENMERALLSWGSGKRTCLGKHIAELEMKKILPTMLLTFQFRLVDPETMLPMLNGIIELDSRPLMIRVDKRPSVT